MQVAEKFVSENELAKAWRVDRSAMRKARRCLRGGELKKTPDGFQWAVAAAERVAGELGLVWKHPDTSAEKNAPEIETLAVVRAAVNPLIVICRRANGEEVPVRVADNSKYVPRLADGRPMVLQARKSHAGNWWLLVGREPRWRGVW